jgi:hypothetical protein
MQSLHLIRISRACWPSDFEVLVRRDRQGVLEDDESSDSEESRYEWCVVIGLPEAQFRLVDS